MSVFPQPSLPDWRVEHADCLQFLRSLPAESVDVVTTDPAYSGMNQHMSFGHGRIVGRYADAANPRWFTEFRDDPGSFLALLAELHRVMRDGGHLYVMFDSFSLLSLGPLVRDRFAVKNLIIWDKVNLGMGHYYRRRHETVLFATKGRRRLSRRDLPDVWAVKRIHRAAYPTQKPVALFTHMLMGSAEPGMTVCDPFVGSGSSAVAALRHGCDFVGADISTDAVRLSSRRCGALLEVGTDPLEPGWEPAASAIA
ncbi:MAG: site-specific DNA-methyltransferase [Candidatus Dormibacteraeota bacterium]|nr:site-specific DNA-methyltransferase [Candidatus Dormibacteraeota bacterium]